MSLGRQGRHYLFIGGIQWLVDWGVMVALSHFGLRIGPANVAGRISGALLGYRANGKLTFAGDETAFGRTQNTEDRSGGEELCHTGRFRGDEEQQRKQSPNTTDTSST